MNEKKNPQKPMHLIFGGILNISRTYPLVFMYNKMLISTTDSEN